MLKWGSAKPRIEVVKWSHLGWFGVPLFWETFILFGWLELQHSRWYAWINGSSGRRCLFLLCSCGCLSISVARHLLGSILVSDSNMSLPEMYTGKNTLSVQYLTRPSLPYSFQISDLEKWGHSPEWAMVHGHPVRPTNESWYTNHSTFLWMTIPEVLPFIFHGIPLRPDFRSPDGPSPKLQTSATLSPWILETRWYVEVYTIHVLQNPQRIWINTYKKRNTKSI